VWLKLQQACEVKVCSTLACLCAASIQASRHREICSKHKLSGKWLSTATRRWCIWVAEWETTPNQCITIVQLHSKKNQQTLGITHCNPPKKCTSGKNISFSSAATWKQETLAVQFSGKESITFRVQETPRHGERSWLSIHRSEHEEESTYPW
jgi:hypothetical protein